MPEQSHWFVSYTLPEGQRFSSFGTAHFIYMAIGAIALVALALLARKLERPRAGRVIKAGSIVLIVLYVFRAYMYYRYYPGFSFLDILPLHLCILSVIILPVAVYTENAFLGNVSYAVLMPGALFAILTPETVLGYFHAFGWMPLIFYVWHFLVAAIPLMLVSSGKLIPDIRKYPPIILSLSGYALIIYCFNKQLNTNFMFLNKPAKGTIIWLFGEWLGNPGYIILLALLAFFLIFLMFVPWWLRGRIRNSDKAGNKLK